MRLTLLLAMAASRLLAGDLQNAASQPPAGPMSATVTLEAGQAAKPISPDLVGIFFEDLNYAADGGLYAELVQNRSFEYSASDRKEWNSLTAWELVQRGDGKGAVQIEGIHPLNPNNPHYAVLSVLQAGEGVGLSNTGFDGIPLKAGDRYDVALFARTVSGQPGPIAVRLESPDGARLGEAMLPAPTPEWTRQAATITAKAGHPAARLVVLVSGTGSVGLDMVSLFPQTTFRNRPNGLRADLAQVVADLKPKFMRFPGGCLAHGDGLANMYRWKDTIGPVEQRKEQRNIWHYHQTAGLGYFEYFQFCEDIGAKALPVLPAGVCCQNSGGTRETGQKGLPMEQMADYIQEVLDLVEWANGPATSTWGAKRAAAGHPAPFNLKYIGVGNEDCITPVFKERFNLIHAAVKAKHPEITVIGTVGPRPDGPDFDEGWKLAREQKVEIVDEHYYKSPDWFWDHLRRYDSYDRKGPKVYVGEYAAHDNKRRSTLRSALAEAACLTALERNADVVPLASYAPLLAKQGHTQWQPDLIYFDNATISPTINYHVQQLFSVNSGDAYLPAKVVQEPAAPINFTSSIVKDSKSGDLIVKLVSRASVPMRTTVDLAAAGPINPAAIRTVLTGDPMAENRFGQPPAILPQASAFTAGTTFTCELPPCSLTIIRLKTAAP